MELNGKSNSPGFENPNLASCDFSPQEPHQPVAQKVLKFDVPDISVISDSASEGSALFSKTFGSRTASSRIPKYHQTSTHATSGFYKTPVVSTESENPNRIENMYEPIPNQCRLVKFSHKSNLNNIDSHEVMASPLSRQKSSVSVLPDECSNSSVQSFNRAEEKDGNRLDHFSLKSKLHHDGLPLPSQNICYTDTFDNPSGSSEQLSVDIISDINSDLGLCRKPPDSISVPSYSKIPLHGEHHLIQSPHCKRVTENEGDFCVCANNQPALKSTCRTPLNSSVPEYVDNFPRHPVSHTEKYRESKDKENGFISSENTNKQIVSSAQFQNKCSCCVRSSSALVKRTIGTSSLNSISATDVENMNKCLIEKPEMDVWKYLKEQDRKLHDLQSQISLFLQQKESCCSAKADQKGKCMPGHKYLDMELSHGLSEDNQYDINLNQSFILRYLKEHNDQICRLQDQVDLLLRRTEELESFHSEKDKSRSSPEPIAFSDNKCDSSLKEANFNSADDICQVNADASVVCQEQTQVKKTSTSTMTSLTLEGSDKLVFRKMLTVVTGVSNCQKDVSAQCSQKKNSPACDTQAKTTKTNKDSPKSQKETVRKDKYSNTTPKSAGFKKQDQKSQKRSLNKSKKTNQELHHQDGEINLNGDNADSQVLSPQFRTNNDKCSSPLFDSDRENKLVNEFRSPNEKILPLFKSIERNINQLVLENDNQSDSEPSPLIAKHLQKSSRHPTACKTKSPHAVLSPPKRKVKPRRSSSRRSSSTSSNTSIDSFYESSHAMFQESSTVSSYGCCSPNLSLATKQYLEKNGLVSRRSSSHNDDSERVSSKKSRTPACRRQLK